MAKVEWTEDAIKDLNKLDKEIADRVLKKISWLSDNFKNIIPEPLSEELKGMFKLRIGSWRAIYTIENQIIVIYYIGHRKDIYKR